MRKGETDMRLYDIDIVVHVRCGAYTEEEAREVVTEQFRDGAYNDCEDGVFELKNVKEVL